jgi:hypothetical protein
MVRLLKSRRAWTGAIVAVLVLAVLVYFLPYYRGMLMAHIDCARGHYEIKVIGGPLLPEPKAEEFGKYAQLLEERYGVVLNVVAGCVVTDDLDQYVKGYNSVSERLLRKKHGLDIFEQCQRLVWPDTHAH